MTSKEANTLLRELYETEVPTLISNLKNIESHSLSEFSYPLLPHIFEDYFTASRKIVFVGKETNGGWGTLDNHNYPISDLITSIFCKYVNFDFGKDVDNNKWRLNSAFWRFCHEIFNSLNKIDANNFSARDYKRGFIWLNQCRVDQRRGTPKKDSFKEILNWSTSLLCKEIEILKPDVIVFIGNSHYRYWLAEDIKERENGRFHVEYKPLIDQSEILFEMKTNFFNENTKIFYSFHPERKKTEDLKSVRENIIALA